jgi:DNA-binding NarL/FixJ family response regulator
MLQHITVIIGHCHPEFGIILQNIIRSQRRLCLVAIASTAAELLQLAVSHVPDIIIADVALPGMNGLNLVAYVAAIRKPAQFIFSWHYRDKLLIKPFTGLAPVSCIGRDAAPSEYIIAIKQAMLGKPYYCAQTKKIIDTAASPMDEGLPETFGKKYRLLIYCEILGFNCKETAVGTGLKERSVRVYRTRYRKLLGSRSFELLIWAFTKLIDNNTNEP